MERKYNILKMVSKQYIGRKINRLNVLRKKYLNVYMYKKNQKKSAHLHSILCCWLYKSDYSNMLINLEF